MMNNWQYILRDWHTHEPVMDLSDAARNAVCYRGTSRNSSLTLQIDMSLPIARLLYGNRFHKLQAKQWNPLTEEWAERFAGSCINISVDYDQGVPLATLNAVGPYWQLERRYSFRSFTPPPEGREEEYVEQEAGRLAAYLIQATNLNDGPTGIRAANADQGESGLIWVDKNSSWQKVSDQIEELANADPGIEWDILPGWWTDGQGAYNGRFVSAARLGVDRDEHVVFEYGGPRENLSSARESWDLTDLATRFVHVQGDATPYAIEESGGSLDDFGVYEDLVSESLDAEPQRRGLLKYHAAYRGGAKYDTDVSPISHQRYSRYDTIPFVHYSYGDTVGYRLYHPDDPKNALSSYTVRVDAVEVTTDSNGTETAKLDLSAGTDS